MAATQDNQAVAGPDPEEGSEISCNSRSSSATYNDNEMIYPQGPGACQEAEQAAPAQGPQLFTAAHADDAIGAPAPFSLTPKVERKGIKRGM